MFVINKRLMKFSGIVVFGILLFTCRVFAQDNAVNLLPMKVTGQDTIPFAEISGVEVFAFKIFKTRHESQQNARLVRNVKKVYPYAKLAGSKLREYELILSKVETEREKNKIMKALEQEIKDEYGKELEKLTISQGKILIKLIDRETGNTSYELVKDFRGSFLAFFYQSFARIFGYDLKTKYDPDGEDQNIEVIVRMIENGLI